jgi:hypothetical protein
MADVQNVTPDMGGWKGGKAQVDEMAQVSTGQPKDKIPTTECINQAEMHRKTMMTNK